MNKEQKLIYCSLTLVLLLSHGVQVEGRIYQLIRELIQTNVAGVPLTHEVQTYDFNPDVSKQRREQFYEVNGYRGEQFITRIGLGNDGKHAERLEEQMKRDEGHLNGINYFLP